MDEDTIAEENPKVKPLGAATGFLARTLARKQGELAGRLNPSAEAQARARARDRAPVRNLAAALRGSRLRIIAEIKRVSPAAGPLDLTSDIVARARAYAAGGAAAVSVLTDAAFGGSLADLEAIAGRVPVPVLRKDFLIHPFEIWESRAAGADAALVIVAALGDANLRALVDAAAEAGLGLLVEIHGPDDVARAAALAPPVVGVNARDLTTLEMAQTNAYSTLAAMRRDWGPDVVLVAESGIRGPDDLRAARAAGADAVLVGEYLMRAADPERAVAGLSAPPDAPR
ncbi:MAG: indole-3-glycerol phosphate synthase TrpC [Gemmatimonadota bacterium]